MYGDADNVYSFESDDVLMDDFLDRSTEMLSDTSVNGLSISSLHIDLSSIIDEEWMDVEHPEGWAELAAPPAPAPADLEIPKQDAQDFRSWLALLPSIRSPNTPHPVSIPPPTEPPPMPTILSSGYQIGKFQLWLDVPMTPMDESAIRISIIDGLARGLWTVLEPTTPLYGAMRQFTDNFGAGGVFYFGKRRLRGSDTPESLRMPNNATIRVVHQYGSYIPI